MDRLIVASTALALALAIAGCGNQVRMPMGAVPNTPEMGAFIGNQARMMGCAGRPRRGRYQIRCPGILHPQRHLYMVIFDDASMECIAEAGFEDDCQYVFNHLIGAPPPQTAPQPVQQVYVQQAPPPQPVVVQEPAPQTVVVQPAPGTPPPATSGGSTPP